MCGIVGAVGNGDVVPMLLDGLRRLEYRGYDSAGIGVPAHGSFERRRCVGKIDQLAAVVREQPLSGRTGIGHTRWATHGAVAVRNAHPQASDRVAVVHNGIIENYEPLRRELAADGYVFESETDTEVIPALISRNLQAGMSPADAVSSALSRLEGAFAVAVMVAGVEDKLYAARRGSPLVIGHGDNEMYLSSDVGSLLPYTKKFTFLEEGDWCEIGRTSFVIFDTDGNVVERPARVTEQQSAEVDKGGFAHYTLKEIHDQPMAVQRTVASYINRAEQAIFFPRLPVAPSRLNRINIVATGASRYAGMVGKYCIERLARIPVDVEVASEFADRDPAIPDDGIVLAISQSGETADTLRAVRLAKKGGHTVVSIINVPESTLGRESDVILPTLAGQEIGLAATKTFSTQLTVLTALAIHLARVRGAIGRPSEQLACDDLMKLPSLLERVLSLDESLRTLAEKLSQSRDLIVLGRGVLYPIADMGALMMSQLAYINASAYPAGELKHGPLALVEPDMPVIALVHSGGHVEKLKSNLMEVRARGAQVIVLTDIAAELLDVSPDHAVHLPASVGEIAAPFAFTVVLQLLAYHLAVSRGTDVDQPRNLAKSVTVE